MPTALAPATLRTIRRVWAELLGTTESRLEHDGVTAVSWDGFPSATVVKVAGATVVGAPPSALERIQGLGQASLSDPESLMRALKDLRPRLFGAAELAYLDAGTFIPSASRTAAAAERDDVERMLRLLPRTEREDSGLEEMERWWAVRTADGTPVAVAGCETWNGALAHLGVAVAPEARGTGAGADVAAAGVAHALRAGLIVQWRSGVQNHASRRLGLRLGAVPLGQQVTVDLSI